MLTLDVERVTSSASSGDGISPEPQDVEWPSRFRAAVALVMARDAHTVAALGRAPCSARVIFEVMGGVDPGPRVDVMGGADRGQCVDVMGGPDPARYPQPVREGAPRSVDLRLRPAKRGSVRGSAIPSAR